MLSEQGGYSAPPCSHRAMAPFARSKGTAVAACKECVDRCRAVTAATQQPGLLWSTECKQIGRFTKAVAAIFEDIDETGACRDAAQTDLQTAAAAVRHTCPLLLCHRRYLHCRAATCVRSQEAHIFWRSSPHRSARRSAPRNTVYRACTLARLPHPRWRYMQTVSALERAARVIDVCARQGRLQAAAEAVHTAAEIANVAIDLHGALQSLADRDVICDAMLGKQLGVTLAELAKTQQPECSTHSQVVAQLRALCEETRVRQLCHRVDASSRTTDAPAAGAFEAALIEVVDGCASLQVASAICIAPSRALRREGHGPREYPDQQCHHASLVQVACRAAHQRPGLR